MPGGEFALEEAPMPKEFAEALQEPSRSQTAGIFLAIWEKSSKNCSPGICLLFAASKPPLLTIQMVKRTGQDLPSNSLSKSCLRLLPFEKHGKKNAFPTMNRSLPSESKGCPAKR